MAAVVRQIRHSEVETLKRVRLAALADSPSAFGSTFEAEAERPDDFWEERARQGADAVDRITFFAFLNDEAVGLVGGLLLPEAAVVELVSMWIAPTARRSGVARSLAVAVVQWARLVSANAVELWVTVGNVPARRLYESIGFCWHLLTNDCDYQDLGGDWFARRTDTDKRRDHLIRQLHDLGYGVTLTNLAA
jgi:GNAT superfamily N-acetyltransferase